MSLKKYPNVVVMRDMFSMRNNLELLKICEESGELNAGEQKFAELDEISILKNEFPRHVHLRLKWLMDDLEPWMTINVVSAMVERSPNLFTSTFIIHCSRMFIIMTLHLSFQS